MMKVLVLGLPRTGTQSLADALIQLGVTPVYHMREVAKNNHQALWIEAIESKFEAKGKQWRPEEFEHILSGFEGVSDYPASIFPEELMAAYPEANVILSIRPVEAWFKSMMSTLVHHHANRSADNPSSMFGLATAYHKHCWDNDFPANGKTFFYEHNSTVRRAAKDRKFLEYEAGSGWEPLCAFLGVEAPGHEFPRNDDWAGYEKMVEDQERN